MASESNIIVRFAVKALFFVIFLPFTSNAFDVTVGIAPQKYIAEKIGGDLITVHSLMDRGVDPHSFSPKPSQAAELARSKIFFGIGFPYEKVLAANLKKTFKQLIIIDASAGLMDNAEDPHLWTSPKMLMKLAEATLEGLISVDPQNSAAYTANCAFFIQELSIWDDKFTTLFASGVNRSFLAYHPFLGYFARDYGLIQYSVEKEGKPPKSGDIAVILDTVKKEDITVFIAVKTHSIEPALFIAEQSGLKVALVDPLTDNLPNMLQEIYDAFSR
ncbi:MAG: zinc ABC transporter substrate-binding protein [Deferribacteraceae bacterium]|jgi:zinc transport system substrate-binding protein|nr:zinc ABC transporter substrate-binding protein [Deferribacteraceae bacterium]